MSATSFFIYAYCKYLSCITRKSNSELDFRKSLSYALQGSTEQTSKDSLEDEISNFTKSLNALASEIETALATRFSEDSYITFVLALMNHKLGNTSKALDLLLQAITLRPSNWAAWHQLSQFIPNRETLENVLSKFPGTNCWMKIFFEVEVCTRLLENDRALEVIRFLTDNGFAGSLFLQSKVAINYDCLRLIESSHNKFKEVFAIDPYLLDFVDIFSNVLYVREKSAELAELAHHCNNTAKYLPQTCCVVGNFFGLRGQHDKALLYFQRALKLKPDYALVWLLIGHEHVELRTINLAIHAYQQSIKHNPLDYRAWYGLGQMHELLNLPVFAVRYYLEAQYLFPIDSRPLIALGEMYNKLGRSDEARKCFWRAYSVGDSEGGVALIRLARCYEAAQEKEKATAAYLQFIKLSDKHGVENESELAHAYVSVVHFCIANKRYHDAQLLANRCLEFLDSREIAKSLLRQIAGFIGLEEDKGDLPSSSFPSKLDLENLSDVPQTSTQIKKQNVEIPMELTPSYKSRKALKDFLQKEESSEKLLRITMDDELSAHDKIKENAKPPMAPEILMSVESSPIVAPTRGIRDNFKFRTRSSLLHSFDSMTSKPVLTPIHKHVHPTFGASTSTPIDSVSAPMEACDLSAVEEILAKNRASLELTKSSLADEPRLTRSRANRSQTNDEDNMS
ncbi:Anaphase-promoting complex subunit 23 [Cichlidogyrus casuarinus]|uniref:Anaphase-promoting complex subunit 23 n=1 Tax=Cichlidogyrus casuarinus TaxID=1844966 RepID=A0ABD2QLX7_9PLAT